MKTHNISNALAQIRLINRLLGEVNSREEYEYLLAERTKLTAFFAAVAFSFIFTERRCNHHE